MSQTRTTLSVETPGRALVDITKRINAALAGQAIREGLVHLFLQHTSASLVIQENADPEVGRDLLRFFDRLAPDGDPLFHHTSEGVDDMPAHARTALTQVDLTIPVANARLLLGTWQGVYLFEHRHQPHTRTIIVTVQGVSAASDPDNQR